jgi:uncharacterized small protein (DUF1192 family)
MFHYRDEDPTVAAHVGVIAEDTPYPLADAKHHSIDLVSSLAVALKGEQELNVRILALEAEVQELRATNRRQHP